VYFAKPDVKIDDRFERDKLYLMEKEEEFPEED